MSSNTNRHFIDTHVDKDIAIARGPLKQLFNLFALCNFILRVRKVNNQFPGFLLDRLGQFGDLLGKDRDRASSLISARPLTSMVASSTRIELLRR